MGPERRDELARGCSSTLADRLPSSSPLLHWRLVHSRISPLAFLYGLARTIATPSPSTPLTLPLSPRPSRLQSGRTKPGSRSTVRKRKGGLCRWKGGRTTRRAEPRRGTTTATTEETCTRRCKNLLFALMQGARAGAKQSTRTFESPRASRRALSSWPVLGSKLSALRRFVRPLPYGAPKYRSPKLQPKPGVMANTCRVSARRVSFPRLAPPTTRRPRPKNSPS